MLTIIGAVLLQSVGLGWWASNISNRVGSLENADIEQKAYIAARVRINEDRWQLIQQSQQQMIKFDTQIGFIFDAVKDIKSTLVQVSAQAAQTQQANQQNLQLNREQLQNQQLYFQQHPVPSSKMNQ